MSPLGRLQTYALKFSRISMLCAAAFLWTACSSDRNTVSLLNNEEAVNFIKPQSINTACDLESDPYGYRLGAEDILNISIYNENELTGTYNIGQNGTIDMPLIGSVLVAGCTLEQAEKLLHAKFSDGYLIDPSISTEIETYRPFYILGEVSSPGKYPYESNLTVLKAAAMAGGFTYRANQRTADILRNTVDNSKVYEAEVMETHVRPGDVIFVKERLF